MHYRCSKTKNTLDHNWWETHVCSQLSYGGSSRLEVGAMGAHKQSTFDVDSSRLIRRLIKTFIGGDSLPWKSQLPVENYLWTDALFICSGAKGFYQRLLSSVVRSLSSLSRPELLGLWLGWWLGERENQFIYPAQLKLFVIWLLR